MLPAYSPAVDLPKPTGIRPIAVTSAPVGGGHHLSYLEFLVDQRRVGLSPFELIDNELYQSKVCLAVVFLLPRDCNRLRQCPAPSGLFVFDTLRFAIVVGTNVWKPGNLSEQLKSSHSSPAWAQFATLSAHMLADLRHRQLQIKIP
jgi:hypothetical protein